MAGSSVAAMVVGTVFIMIFGLATVSLVDSVNESIKNADYELPEPRVEIVSAFDQEMSTGPVESLSISNPGSGYVAEICTVSGATGIGLTFSITVGGSGEITGVTIVSAGNGYTELAVRDVDCPSGGSSAQVSIDDLHDQNNISIINAGSETIDLSHIYVTFSNTEEDQTGLPFAPFVNHYSGPNLYLFPGESLTTDDFALDPSVHGFTIDADPNRAFLAIYDYNDAESVTIT